MNLRSIIHQLQQLGTKPRFHPTSDMDRAMLQKLINADIVWFKLDEHEKERVGLNRKYDRSVLI